MSIVAKCSCGATFKARPELAGKAVACPSCRQTMQIPQSQAAAKPIRVDCRCGKSFHAKPELAGRQLKCPDCGQALAIPVPRAAQPSTPSSGPVDLSNTASDPLFSGGGAADPLGIGGMPQDSAAPASPTAGITKPTRKKKNSQLVTAAGWVAIVYGSYQVLMNVISLLGSLFFSTAYGAFGGVLGFNLFNLLVNVLAIALGVWLALSGMNIVRGASRRDSLERAAQASMVYLALTLLGMIWGSMAVFAAAGLRSLGPAVALVFIAGLVMQAVYLVPPGFILYVDSTQKRKH